MKKIVAAASLVGVAILLIFAAMAMAGGPENSPSNGPRFNPCDPHGSPSSGPLLTDLRPIRPPFCDRDNVVVEDEEPGANCPNGGIKVTVVNGKRDGSDQPAFPDQIAPGAVEPSEDPGQVTTNGEGPPPPKPEIRVPKPDPADEVFFVCNGATGPAGPAGPQGPQGPPGAVQLPSGGTGIPTVGTPKVCQSSTRIGVRLFLPPRLARFGVVRLQIAKVNGPLRFNKNVRTRVPRDNPNGPVFVFVPLRARNCGSYLITVGRGSVEPVIQIWKITGRFGLVRTTITG